MKRILLLLLLFSARVYAQPELAVISITAQARDFETVGAFSGGDDLFQDMDSVLKSKFRPQQTAPSGTTTVIVGSVTVQAWRAMMNILRDNSDINQGNNNEYTRLDVILRAINNAWLTAGLDADVLIKANRATGIRQTGRVRLKRGGT